MKELLPEDFIKRVAFCQFIQHIINFLKKILFSDKVCVIRRGTTNLHNYHEYSDINPQSIIPRYFQIEYKINVRVGIYW